MYESARVVSSSERPTNDQDPGDVLTLSPAFRAPFLFVRANMSGLNNDVRRHAERPKWGTIVSKAQAVMAPKKGKYRKIGFETALVLQYGLGDQSSIRSPWRCRRDGFSVTNS